MRDLLRRIHGEDRSSGVTLVELLITMTIFSVVLAMTYSVLITVQKQTRDQTARADAVGDARLALQQIDRQVRSGNVLSDPSTETLDMSMRIYTQANGDQRCVQWQVDESAAVLRSRSWEPGWTSADPAPAWGVVAHNVVNTGSTTAPFSQPGGATGERLVDITLLVHSDASEGKPIEVTSSMSGRNTAYGYDVDICKPGPPA